MARRRRRPPALPPYLRPLNDAQIRARANQQLEDLMRPQRTQLESEARSRAATIQAASQAASALLASHAGITGDAYAQANQELQGIGSGYSDEMKARIQASQAAASKFAGSQGAPAAPPAVDASALGDTIYHGGVGIPGSSLASQGASAVAAQNEQAGIPLLQGAQDIRQSEQESEKALLELAQQRPELRDKIMNELYDREMAKLDARLKQQAQDLYQAQFGETVRSHLTNEQLSQDRNTISEKRYEEQVRQHDLAISKAKAQGRQPNASLSRAYGYIVDAQGNPILDKDGKHIPVHQNTSASSKKQKANKQYEKAAGEAANMYEASQPGQDANGLPTPPKRAWRWGNALRYLMTRYGITRARARQALIAGGFRPPGKPTHAGNGGNYGGRGGQ